MLEVPCVKQIREAFTFVTIEIYSLSGYNWLIRVREKTTKTSNSCFFYSAR